MTHHPLAVLFQYEWRSTSLHDTVTIKLCCLCWQRRTLSPGCVVLCFACVDLSASTRPFSFLAVSVIADSDILTCGKTADSSGSVILTVDLHFCRTVVVHTMWSTAVRCYENIKFSTPVLAFSISCTSGFTKGPVLSFTLTVCLWPVWCHTAVQDPNFLEKDEQSSVVCQNALWDTMTCK